MTRVVWTREARADLRSIAEYIALDSPHYASLVVARLLDSVSRLGQFPESGRSVPERPGTDLREVISPPFRIVYQHAATAGTVYVLTVFRAERLFPGHVGTPGSL